MGTAESVFLGEDEGGKKGSASASETDDPLNYSNLKTSYSKTPKIVGYVIGDVQTGKSSLICRLRGEDDLSGASNEYTENLHSTEEVILPWSLLHPSSSPSNDVDFHVQIYKPTTDESSSYEMVSFALFLIDPKRLESTLKFSEEVARDLLQKQILRVTGNNNIIIPPWISTCVLLNFCDEDSGVIVKESFLQQAQQLAQRIQKFQSDLYLPYYNDIVSTTKIMENNVENNDFCSYSICTSMKTCYGLQALYSFFPIVYHRWKEWNTIQTILQLQKKNTLQCHKSMQKMAHLNQHRFFLKQKQKLEHQQEAVTAEKNDNRAQVSFITAPKKETIITDDVQRKENDTTSEQQRQLARIRQMQKKVVTINAEIGTKVLSPAKTIPTPPHKLVENLSSTKSSKVDAQKALDLFLGEDDDDDEYKNEVYRKASLPFQEENSTTSNEDDDDFYYDQQGKKHQSVTDRNHSTYSDTKQQAIEENIKSNNDKLIGSSIMSKITAQMSKEPVKEVGFTSDDGWDWNGEDEDDVSDANSQSSTSGQNLTTPVALEEKTNTYPSSTTAAARSSCISGSPLRHDLNENDEEAENPLLTNSDDYTQVEEVSSTTRKVTTDRKKIKKKKSHERNRQ